MRDRGTARARRGRRPAKRRRDLVTPRVPVEAVRDLFDLLQLARPPPARPPFQRRRAPTSSRTSVTNRSTARGSGGSPGTPAPSRRGAGSLSAMIEVRSKGASSGSRSAREDVVAGAPGAGAGRGTRGPPGAGSGSRARRGLAVHEDVHHRAVPHAHQAPARRIAGHDGVVRLVLRRPRRGTRPARAPATRRIGAVHRDSRAAGGGPPARRRESPARRRWRRRAHSAGKQRAPTTIHPPSGIVVAAGPRPPGAAR